MNEDAASARADIHLDFHQASRSQNRYGLQERFTRGEPMKRLGDLMREIGFKPEAAQSTQEAFIRNLAQQAFGPDAWKRAQEVEAQRRRLAAVGTQTKPRKSESNKKALELFEQESGAAPGEQLSFDFEKDITRTGTGAR